MTLQNQLNHKLETGILLKRALSGAGVALLLLSVFLWMFGDTESFIWIAVTTVSIAGAGAGIFYYLLCDFLKTTGFIRILTKILSALVFLAAFWLSLVFALAQVGLWD